MSEGKQSRPASAWPRRLVVPGKLLLGLLVPTGLYYLLRADRSDRHLVHRQPVGAAALAYLFTKPLLQGRLRWPRDWDALWEMSPRFRRMWRISSLL